MLSLFRMVLLAILFLLPNLCPAKEFQETCTLQNSKNCSELASLLRGEKNFQKAFDYDVIGCRSGENSSCTQLQLTADSLTKKHLAQAKEILIERCKIDEEVCGDLASIYYDENDRAKAMELDKKYFEKYGFGFYPLEIYKDGKKEEALALALKNCEKQGRCIPWINNFPDHPQMGALLKRSEIECKKDLGVGENAGATTCSLLGSYYYKNKNFDKAYSLWKSECETHVAEPCLLIMGSNAPESMKSDAYADYCRGIGNFGFEPVIRLRDKVCKTNPKIIQDEVRVASKQEFSKFVGSFENAPRP